jgi:hypothetical protein
VTGIAAEQWDQGQQDRFYRHWDAADRLRRDAKDAEAVAFLAELNTVLHASLVAVGGDAEAAAAVEAEMVQGALRAADEAEEASRVEALRDTLATIAALTAADAADEAAAPAEAAAEVAAAETACLICLENRACTVRCNRCGKKMCLQCYTQVQKCPYHRADLSRQ